MAAHASSEIIKYDVFLSFRGTDTRRGFLSHLHKALEDKHIKTYVDYMLREGTEISHSLLAAIEQSEIALIIFSQDYASSKWCLEELAKIMECREKNGQIVIPIFHNVDPSWVRHQKEIYHHALANHEVRFADRVQIWRDALKEAANLSGFHSPSSSFRDDADLVGEIVKRVLQRLNQSPQGDLQGLVGIHGPIEKLVSLCTESEAVTVGLWGMGGVGKTTLATAVFNRLCDGFEGFCFLNNVRERAEKYGIDHLKKELLSKLLKEEDASPFVTPGGITNFAKKRLSRTKVLVVLDDVNDSDQMEDLCGGHTWFGASSRIIVTTRDKHVLVKADADHIHEVETLNSDDSLRLFSLNAFKQNCTIEAEQVELSKRVLNYCKGLPLALKILGSFLKGKTQREWESELLKLEKMPDEKIQSILRLSYNELDRNDRNIFLHLACFFYTNTEEELIQSVLDSCGYATTIGLTNLHNKALISVSNGYVSMHDLIREMGREIVREESLNDPGKRSRLWDPQDICKVLKDNKGTDAIESIELNMSEIDRMSLHPETFERMAGLKLVRFHAADSKNKLYAPEGIRSMSNELRYFHWDEFPLKSLPPSLSVERIVEIIMPNSGLQTLWEGEQTLVNLRKVDLDGSSSLMELPDLSKASNLREVSISGCKSLCQVPPSAICSQKLKYLNVSNCESLESIAELPASVVCVIARDCRSLHTVSVSALDSVAEEAIQQQQFEDITFNFSNCYKLEENAKKSIMEHAYGRLKRPLAAAPTCATTAWLDKEDKHPYRYLSGKQHNHPKLNVLSGADPGWFRYINPQNGAVTLDVAPGDSLLGFIFWVVFPAYYGSYQVSATSVSYTYCVEVRNGPSFSYDGHWMPDEDIWLNDYYFWYDGQCCIDMIKVMEENTNTNNNNIQLKVSFKFLYNRLILSQPIEEDDDKEVEYWGVHPIYASDVRGGMSMESVNDVNLNMNVPSIEEGNGGSIDDSDEDDEGSERGGVSESVALMHGGRTDL
ncbi:disease resistance protein RPV1-like [Arachis stenosperma]|uniref:disease resistance protein RPV1-like n=1 Tax=Arachis stenosperma TaxID=217475 RepID=UPI0025AD43DA|nr:disease resistance protein RPV1-like [Arachis stenosperma]XP_057727785.1 disease resistance protein RPV1-like [Arachis stenosperma]